MGAARAAGRARGRWPWRGAALLLAVLASAGGAQEVPAPAEPSPAAGASPRADAGFRLPGTGPASRVASPVLTVDQEELFSSSAFGRRVRAELEEASRTLAAENRRIEAELTAEERALTDLRATLAPEAFRPRARAFDDRVVRIRAEQDAKTRDLGRRAEQERQRFFEAALPVLGSLIAEMGAAAILDSRAILISVQGIDVTEAAVARLDATLGDGLGNGPSGAVPAPEAGVGTP